MSAFGIFISFVLLTFVGSVALWWISPNKASRLVAFSQRRPVRGVQLLVYLLGVGLFALGDRVPLIVSVALMYQFPAPVILVWAKSLFSFSTAPIESSTHR